MGLDMYVAGDHPRHGTEYLVFLFWQRVYTVMSGSDPHSTCNVDSDGHPKTELD